MSRPRRSRRAGIRPTVGLVVEGDTEFVALPRLYKGKLIPACPPLKPTNLGGVGAHMTPKAIALRVAPHVIAHQIAGRSRVVVSIDREQRPDCPPGLAAGVYSELQQVYLEKGRPIADLGTVSIVIADRTFEAWILAGAAGLYREGALATCPTSRNFEGQLGQQQRKGVVELGVLLGRPYRKTTDGPNLFCRLDFGAARTASKSLDKFLRSIGV